MTNKEARDILMRWNGCHNTGPKLCLDNYDCENCQYNHTDKEVFNAVCVAIESIKAINVAISETLEIVSEYIDDCILTHDIEVFGKTVKMIPVEMVHRLLERIEEEATGGDSE